MNLHATQLHEGELKGGPAGSPPTSPPGRFAYSSGAKPLAGYTIKRGIGHGGFGEVYYATSDAGKEVALKLIRRNLDIELRGVTQCLNLKHPNLLSLYDVRQDDKGDNWVVMELVSGESLEDLLNRSTNGLPTDEVLAWIHGIAAGVAYLHDHGIVHRDLKPGNIFIDEGIVKIGDYGLSKFISCSRRSGQTGSVGTVHYMAPEIANGRYGKEIDIYALGIILYEMLTGHVPFEGESVGEILMKHLTAEPDVQRVAEPYRTIVSRALAKDPNKRFSSVNELIALLPPAPASTGVRFAGPTGMPAAPVSDRGTANTTGFDLHPQIQSAQKPGQSQPPGSSESPPNQNANNSDPPRTTPPHKDPFAQWASETSTQLRNWWVRMNFRPWQKVVILILGLWIVTNVLADSNIAGFLNRHDRPNFGQFLVVVILGFVAYRAIKAGKNYDRSRNSSAPINPATTAAKAAPPPQPQAYTAPPLPVRNATLESPTRRRWRSKNYLVYQPGPPRERVTQLLGSMLLSAAGCLVLSLVMLILRGQSPEPGLYAWLAGSAILGSWSVLIPAKLWEGSRGDPVRRRFVMLVVGLACGVCSSVLSAWLMVDLPRERGGLWDSMTRFARFGADFYSPNGSPQILAFLAYFGFLFVIIRWWRQGDPLRSTRLSIWHTAVAMFWSWLIAAFWAFPQPWATMVAATIAISVQLAAPWLTPAERAQLPKPAAES